MTDLKDMKSAGPHVGRSVERVEDRRFLQGCGTYLGDMTRAGMLSAAVLRSPLAHGRIRAIDVTAALAMPGVVAVITARDLGNTIPRIPLRQESHPTLLVYQQPVIGVDKVRYVGEPLAVVVADTRERAEDALEAVRCEFDELPAVSDRDSAQSNRTVLH